MKKITTQNHIVEELAAMANKLTQKVLASRIGISQQFLSDIITGKKRPSDRVLRYLGYVREEKIWKQ